ncbi:hypothetical protein EVAR_79463_1 [Eumeta japonica]|uniref:Uncharacterized protein n=1 Tax=Eumeta variegata TaxID=151549 RepID=A0A4C1UDN9_EUMVA|nr:hypothetical protein EVAR_79463_1 [Eumeta japonica]
MKRPMILSLNIGRCIVPEPALLYPGIFIAIPESITRAETRLAVIRLAHRPHLKYLKPLINFTEAYNLYITTMIFDEGGNELMEGERWQRESRSGGDGAESGPPELSLTGRIARAEAVT